MPTTIDTLRAVHHPTRRRIIDYLFIHGETQVGTLAKALEQQVGSISHHLRMLERVGMVARAPERASDGRTSWWRLEKCTISWAVDDFAASPADRMQAKAAERLNIEHHVARLAAWKRISGTASEQWRRAAFSSATLAVATPAELAELAEAIARTVTAWRESIDRDDGADRQPVFVFTHAFPSQP